MEVMFLGNPDCINTSAANSHFSSLLFIFFKKKVEKYFQNGLRPGFRNTQITIQILMPCSPDFGIIDYLKLYNSYEIKNRNDFVFKAVSQL